jgi:hypothetical protein
MIEWKPISLEALKRHIELQEFLLTEEERAFWYFVRIEPEKWVDLAYDAETVEFYVIALFGHKVIYYNDIEEGFNIAEFKEYGRLEGDGGANQNDFGEYISHLFTFISSGKPWW